MSFDVFDTIAGAVEIGTTDRIAADAARGLCPRSYRTGLKFIGEFGLRTDRVDGTHVSA